MLPRMLRRDYLLLSSPPDDPLGFGLPRGHINKEALRALRGSAFERTGGRAQRCHAWRQRGLSSAFLGRRLGCAAAGDPRFPRHLSDAAAVGRRADRHQSGGRRHQPVAPVGGELPHRARQSECRRSAVQYTVGLRRRNPDRRLHRACLLLDRRAHQHAVQGIYCCCQHPAAVRTAAGRRRRLGDPGLAQDRA